MHDKHIICWAISPASWLPSAIGSEDTGMHTSSLSFSPFPYPRFNTSIISTLLSYNSLCSAATISFFVSVTQNNSSSVFHLFLESQICLLVISSVRGHQTSISWVFTCLLTFVYRVSIRNLEVSHKILSHWNPRALVLFCSFQCTVVELFY